MNPIEQAIIDERQRCTEVHAAMMEDIIRSFAGTSVVAVFLAGVREEFYRRALTAQYNAAGFNFPPK